MGNSSSSTASDGCSKTTIVGCSKTTTVAKTETETVTGSHVLEVKGYSATKGQMGVGNGIDSSVFSVAGHRWNLQYYPDGVNEESANHISIFVNLINHPVGAADVKARFRFSLLNHAGEPVSRYTVASNSSRTFSSKAASWGCHKFIERNVLESSYDCFQIKFDLTVFKETDAKDQALMLPPADLHKHLGSLLESKVGGDVEFEVDDEIFTAHRCVLAARSSVFMAKLFGPMEPKATDHGPLRIQEMEARVFRCMLHFIYTDSLPKINVADRAVMAQHLLVAADRYDLKRLKLICEGMLRSSMDIGIAATTLVLAEQHASRGLKAACFEFLKAPGNLKAVMATDGFKHLKSSCPSLLEELLAQVAP